MVIWTFRVLTIVYLISYQANYEVSIWFLPHLMIDVFFKTSKHGNQKTHVHMYGCLLHIIIYFLCLLNVREMKK